VSAPASGSADGAPVAEWHLVTGEYPPQPGGVSDHTRLVAGSLAEAGDRVHVWCPAGPDPVPAPTAAGGIEVHRELGRLRPRDLARAGRLLDRHPAPRRLLVQWVPHSYGYRSLNLPFCAWLLHRAMARGDAVELMVHEPFLSYRRGAWKQNAAAAVQRLMTAVLLRAAHRVWVAAPLWEVWWRPFALGRSVPFAWLPIPGNVPVRGDAAAVARVRERYAGGGALLGHFGTYGPDIAAGLRPALPALLRAGAERSLLLVGRGSRAFRDELLRDAPDLEGRVHATGGLPAGEISSHLAAIDLLVQPYPDGVNARRGSLLALLEHGRAVVTTSGRLTEALWSESGAVALAPDGDAGALVSHAERLLGDVRERARLGSAARSLYESCFAVRHTVAALRGASRPAAPSRARLAGRS
jgi:glycosyltransferase involved in cell wall biosynthesis